MKFNMCGCKLNELRAFSSVEISNLVLLKRCLLMVGDFFGTQKTPFLLIFHSMLSDSFNLVAMSPLPMTLFPPFFCRVRHKEKFLSCQNIFVKLFNFLLVNYLVILLLVYPSGLKT